MSVSVERFVDDPIVIFNFSGQLDSDTVEEFNHVKEDLLMSLGAFYAILDVRAINLAREDDAVGVQAQFSPDDLTADTRVRFALLGHANASRASDREETFIFRDKDEIVEHVRKELARTTLNKQASGG